MFTSSNDEIRHALSANSLLEDKLYVAGSLRADKLINFKKNKNNFKDNIGLKPNDKVVHIISTWGANSLVQLYGEELLNQCIKLRHKYKFQKIGAEMKYLINMKNWDLQ